MVLIAFLILMGSSFILIAAIGIWRMPDLLMRMHAATKAGTVGAGMNLLAVMLYFHKINVVVEAGLAILFLMMTAPVASHLLAKVSYMKGLKLSKETLLDEMAKEHI